MKSNITILGGYNNYYNRKVLRCETLDQYKLLTKNISFTDINFMPNDGISTEIILNNTSDIHPDYLLVCDENNAIISRWFVMEETRLRKGQYRYILKRDVCAEYKNTIMNAPCFIQKGMLKENDPFIFNPEGNTYNQIKDYEYLLKDTTGCPWIVGYMDPGFNKTDINAKYTFPKSGVLKFEDLPAEWRNEINTNRPVKTVLDNIEVSFVGHGDNQFVLMHDYDDYINNISFRNNKELLEYKTTLYEQKVNQEKEITNEIYQMISHKHSIGVFEAAVNFNAYLGKTLKKLYDSKADNYNKFSTFVKTVMAQFPTDNSLYQYNDIIYSQNDKYYKINIRKQDSSEMSILKQYGREFDEENDLTRFFNYAIDEAAIQTNELMQKINIDVKTNRITNKNSYFKYDLKCLTNKYIITAEEVEDNEYRVTLPSNTTRVKLNSEPYSMFCIPYGKIILNTKKNYSDKYIGLAVARAIAEAGVGAETGIYDIQILPFCPAQNLMFRNTFNDTSDPKFYEYVYSADDVEKLNPVSIVIWCSENEGTFRIPYVLPPTVGAINKKVKNETEFFRLCSPNYASMFQFKVDMNNGVNYFDVDFSYKPFTPYIHINPDFNGLYGQDWNSPTGLVLAGDFSITVNANKLAEYSLNNKNYQLIFDREIDNLEVNREIQKQQNRFNTAMNVVGGVTATAAGAISGNALATAGGALATVGSLTKGIGSEHFANQSFNETKDYKIDMFNYQMGNIKAQPNTLCKVTALNNNNKIFPVLERYTSTEEEKNALRDQIKYNGMTIMRIGRIRDYLQPFELTYIQGNIIRLEDINEDNHMASVIADEIRKGVFM